MREELALPDLKEVLLVQEIAPPAEAMKGGLHILHLPVPHILHHPVPVVVPAILQDLQVVDHLQEVVLVHRHRHQEVVLIHQVHQEAEDKPSKSLLT